jgi:hypothetical protein
MEILAIFVEKNGNPLRGNVDGYLDQFNRPLAPAFIDATDGTRWRHVTSPFLGGNVIALYVEQCGSATEKFALRAAKPTLQAWGVKV